MLIYIANSSLPATMHIPVLISTSLGLGCYNMASLGGLCVTLNRESASVIWKLDVEDKGTNKIRAFCGLLVISVCQLLFVCS